MDAFSVYHQIKMRSQDQIHTSFRVAGATYCYNVISLGLKNAGATYQQMMNKILKKQIDWNIETYVDDIVVKTKKGCSHLEDLGETFATLTEYGLKLNLTKCTFEVKFHKFLGFMMLQHRIKANPHKIEVVMKLPEPRCVKDIQRLNGCIATLGRFMSKSAERCMPFFEALKLSGKTFQWNKSCAKAWDNLKDYLTRLPLLCAHIPGDVLYMYLSVSEQVISSVLIKESKDKQLPIYFVSRILCDGKIRYPYTESWHTRQS